MKSRRTERLNTDALKFTDIALNVERTPHQLMPLPYPYDALEPYISARTLYFHHDKHHASYVKGLNEAEQELRRALASGDQRWVQAIQQELAFNWGGDVLHQLYWLNLTPNYRPPSARLANIIGKSFGNWRQFREYMKTATTKIPGAGWGVLMQLPNGQLRVASVRNHQNDVLWNAKPLLIIDIWEHAYYLDYQNDRSAYFDAVFDHLVDWAEVERRLG
jgi:Fe-Mn family superoxide dismutase